MTPRDPPTATDTRPDRPSEHADRRTSPQNPPAARPGSARAALSHRAFRVVWLGQLGSSVGSWMQTFVIGVFMDRLTHQAKWVGFAMFAQMVPMLLFTIPGGIIADRFDRRRLLIALQSAQLAVATALGVLALVDKTPSKLAVIALVFGGGVGNSLNAPAYSATLPALVDRADLPGAISLNSAAINGSRVIGPVMGGLLYKLVGAGWLYLGNAATFVFVIVALLRIRLPHFQRSGTAGLDQLLVGFRSARADRVVSRILISLATFSLLSLPFLSLWSTVMRVHLGLTSTGSIGLMYSVFGLGALLGSLAVASRFLARITKAQITRVGFAGFAVTMAAITVIRRPVVAFPVFFVLGAFYFATTTAMLTIVQSRIGESVRGRVMSLWFMAFGGTVALCGPIFGPIVDATSPAVVLGLSATCAAFLAWWCNVARLDAPAG